MTGDACFPHRKAMIDNRRRRVFKLAVSRRATTLSVRIFGGGCRPASTSSELPVFGPTLHVASAPPPHGPGNPKAGHLGELRAVLSPCVSKSSPKLGRIPEDLRMNPAKAACPRLSTARCSNGVNDPYIPHRFSSLRLENGTIVPTVTSARSAERSHSE